MLVLLVVLLHGLALDGLSQALALADPAKPSIARIEATYTRVVAQSAAPTGPPVAPAAQRPKPRPAAARPAATPASEAAADTSVEITVSDPGPAASEPAWDPNAAPGSVAGPPPVAAAPGASAPQMASAASAPAVPDGAASGPAFTWPVSTRLTYTLEGWYQGEVHGDAQVEWLRDGDRYQVHLDVSVGPRLAPLVARRMSSEGRITPDGLRPQRYEQATRQIIGRNRLAQLSFPDERSVRLQDGKLAATRADVQDTASQFIQMVFLFSTRPALREKGRRVEFDLALPHRVRRWAYEVGDTLPTMTPLGELETFHVRPVPPRDSVAETPSEVARSGGSVLSAQVWYAPTLQMLPVRIRIEQDAETWIDLRLSEPPRQAAVP
ncbi:DUF3108 domain-containing protein [uncultured Sphaerotilus sp.]|uniref:DUF3108 domain-containing protein n=1 Tax=uncultured Sphaerotilus sp. TaxID=474984 RepID=UPI0030CA4BF4